jgi:hypothetical protein
MSPKCSPNRFCQNYYKNFTVVTSSPKMLSTFVFYSKLPKVNNYPIGENMPNLVTLASCPNRRLPELPKCQKLHSYPSFALYLYPEHERWRMGSNRHLEPFLSTIAKYNASAVKSYNAINRMEWLLRIFLLTKTIELTTVPVLYVVVCKCSGHWIGPMVFLRYDTFRLK